MSRDALSQADRGPDWGPDGEPDWEREGLDPEGPSASDLERFGSETRACGMCGAEVWDQADRCHACGAPLDDAGPASEKQKSKVGMLVFLLIVVLGGAAAFL